MLVLKFIFAPIFRGNTLHNPGGWTNHCSFKLHNCKCSNLCCCSTHFSYKWEQLGRKIISHVTPFKFFFFAKDHNTYKVITDIIPFLGPWATLFDPADPKAQNLVQWIGSAGPGGQEGPRKGIIVYSCNMFCLLKYIF